MAYDAFAQSGVYGQVPNHDTGDEPLQSANMEPVYMVDRFGTTIGQGATNIGNGASGIVSQIEQGATNFQTEIANLSDAGKLFFFGALIFGAVFFFNNVKEK